MNDNTDPINSPALKVTSAWIAAGFAQIGIASWGDFAAFAASIYTLCLLFEWLWKKVFKPIALRHGWIAYKSPYVGGDDAGQ